jgi:hypothetical protein
MQIFDYTNQGDDALAFFLTAVPEKQSRHDAQA